MAHRMQITLPDEQYALLRVESMRTGLSIAELIRRAAEARYGKLPRDEKLRRLKRAAGSWAEAPDEDRSAYLDELRGPGLGHRVKSPAGP